MAPRRAYRVVAIVVASFVVAGALVGNILGPTDAPPAPARVALSEVLRDVRSHRVSKARMDEEASTVVVDLTSPSPPKSPAQSPAPRSSRAGSRQELAVYP